MSHQANDDLLELARSIAESELAPIAQQIDKDAAYPRDLVATLHQAGILTMTVPTEFGGSGLSTEIAGMVVSIFAEYSGAVSTIVYGSAGTLKPLIKYGSAAQKEEFLRPYVEHGWVHAACITEPDVGSNVGAIRTAARQSDGGFVLSGEKAFASQITAADLLTVVARCEPSGELRPFVLRPSEGVAIGKAYPMLGMRGLGTASVTFDHVPLPPSSVIGEPGTGKAISQDFFTVARIFSGYQSLGLCKAALRIAHSYAVDRSQFGKPISSYQAIQLKIADILIAIETLEPLLSHAAHLYDSGAAAESARVSAVAKVAGSEAAWQSANSAVQILGGAGYTEDHDAARLLRDARVGPIWDGTNEILRIFLARDAASASA